MASPIHIMIGNDLPEYGLTYRTFLTEQGYHITLTPKNGDLLLQEIRRQQPDIVIMEAYMKTHGALFVLDSLSRDPDTKQPGLIVTSNLWEPEMAEELLRAGADYFLRRPFELRELLERIDKLCPIGSGGYSFIAHQADAREQAPAQSLVDCLIIQAFNRLRLPIYAGYDALKDAVKMRILNGRQPITKIVYPYLGKKYGITWKLIERRFRHMIDRLWEIGDIDVLNEFFGTPGASYLCEKPSNSRFISVIAEQIKLTLLRQGVAI